MYTKASIITLLASFATAQLHAPVGQPSGNPILRPLNEVIPTCEPFTIVWQPTTTNTVSVLLLKGPATNVVKFGPALAEGIANSGSLVFTPSADLQPTDGPNGYGLQIIDDVTGQYQYSTQFGFSKGNCAVSSSSVAVTSSSAVAPSSSLAPASSTGGYGGYPVSSAVLSSKASAMVPYPTVAPITTLITEHSEVVVMPTGYPAGNSSNVMPTGTMTVPSSLRPIHTGNVTTSRLPEVTTNAGSALQAGLGMAGAAIAFAFML